MIDWANSLLSFVLGIFSGTIGGIITFYVFNKYFLPQIMAGMGRNTIKSLQKDPEIKPLIDGAKVLMEKGKKMLETLEPILKKAKEIDVDGWNKDLKPLMKLVKEIDAEQINDFIKTGKKLMNAYMKSMEKPEIPEPDPAN